MEEGTKRLGIGGSEKPNRRIPINASSGPFLFRFGVSVVDGSALKGLTPAIGASPNFVLPQKVLSDSNTFYGVPYPELAFISSLLGQRSFGSFRLKSQ